MAIKRFYKIIQPKSPNADLTDSHDIGGNRGLYGNYTWYNRLVQGSATRITRYREYDVMDADIDVAGALNIIAEEMAGNNPKTSLPLQIEVTAGNEQVVPSAAVVTLNAALKTWCALQGWDLRLYQTIRGLIKYGDIFFIRPKHKNKRWIYEPAKNVIGAIVALDDITNVRGWHIKTDTKRVQGNMGTNLYFNVQGSMQDQNVDVFEADEVIRFTMNNDMSEEAPFGESILRAVYRTFKQKELLEDSILIYRISRAPERRAFYIEMGNMPPNKIAAHLEQMKNEIKQKKIPTQTGGKPQIDSIYNPLSQSEDYFFAMKNNAGSRVEMLAGGQNLGQLDDLDYFYKKMWRAFRIPASYMSNVQEDGAVFNDGAVGIAYQQEIKFAQYVERLQKNVEIVMDVEFKRFLHEIKVTVDPTIFKVRLPAPTNWAKSKQQAIDTALINAYNSVKDDTSMSKRFSKLRYLQWEKQDLLINERMLREEKGLDPDGGKQDLPKLYFPEEAEAGGFEAGLGSVGGGGAGGGGGDAAFNGDEDGTEGTEGNESGNESPGNEMEGENPATETTIPNNTNDNTTKQKQ